MSRASDFDRRGRALVRRALAAALRPDPVLTVGEWAEKERMVAPGTSPQPGRWRTALVPYLGEVMNCLSPAHPCRSVVLVKSAQVAGTEAGLNLFGLIATRAPSPMLIVLPTGDEVKKYVRLKLQPTIDATPSLRRKVLEQKSRDEKSSTSTLKYFPGGFCQITGANSSSGLQMISVRVVILEEVSEYPFDVDGRGDPVDLALARTTAFTNSRKVFYNSTPGIKTMCRVSDKYAESDQRRFHLRCPHCGASQVLEWKNLKWRSDRPPHGAYFVCAASGCVIEQHEKTRMIAEGEWIAGQPGPGREPGFHIWQAYSPFVTWDDTVAEYLNAKDNPVKLKVFTQQRLGEAYEESGDSPDYLKLYARREDYRLGTLPPGALMITAGVDVQGNRLEFGVWAWGADKSSWLIDFGIVVGSPSEDATWAELEQVLARRYEDRRGARFGIDMTAIDTGGHHTHTVYEWARLRRTNVMAVKGQAGESRAAIGTPTQQDINYRGKRTKGGISLWPVGTWSLKSGFYDGLAKTIAGPDTDGRHAAGYVHLPMAAGEDYMKQLTAEQLVTRERRDGRQVKEWFLPRDVRNEALDIRVYATAAAVRLGLDRFTARQWAELAARRGVVADGPQGELAALWGGPPTASAAPPVANPPPVPANAEPFGGAPLAQPTAARPAGPGGRGGRRRVIQSPFMQR